MPKEEAESSPKNPLNSILAGTLPTKFTRLLKLINPSTSNILVALLEDDPI